MSTIFAKHSKENNSSSRVKKSSSTGNNNTHSSFASTNEYSTWNVDATLENFTKYGDLPPLLSPTLPSWTKNDRESSRELGNTSKSHSKSYSRTHSHGPSSLTINGGGGDNDDDFDIPKLMLSPTLPGIFEEPVEYRRDEGPHHWIVKSNNKQLSFKLCLFMKPRLLRQIERNAKIKLAPAPVLNKKKILSGDKRKNAETFFSDSDDDQGNKESRVKEKEKGREREREREREKEKERERERERERKGERKGERKRKKRKVKKRSWIRQRKGEN
ncbi:hypothetical protein DASC09_000140 [Saccharomycopsis crataegensis]|uniref:Uncharacterized protein n=1 Tax=Saccharomycopsis crataegensis TaxID=43959 RepID=A0AAV5QDB5_9ASCO|nr:hypothetical protein DASC09_000140 [Saccharomycopsis crataegensis]